MMGLQYVICFVTLNGLEHEILTMCGNLQMITHEGYPSLRTSHSSRQTHYKYLSSRGAITTQVKTSLWIAIYVIIFTYI